MKELDKNELKAFEKECDVFKAYNSIDEYIEDIVTYLVYSTWYYTEEKARRLVERDAEFVKESYERKDPAADCAVDVGYACG